MAEIRKEIPVICAECQCASIHGHNLFCDKMQKTVYNSKPKWCPLPSLFVPIYPEEYTIYPEEYGIILDDDGF